MDRGKKIEDLHCEIGELRRRVAELEQSEEFYRVAVEASNDGIAIMKGPVHLYANRRFSAMFGYESPDEIIGKDQSITVHPDDFDLVRDMNTRRQTGVAVPERYLFKGVTKDGRTIHVEASATQITYHGNPVSLAFLRDVTENTKAQEALSESEEKYRNIFEHAIEGIFQTTPNGRFISANPALARMYGYASPEDLIETVTDLQEEMYVDPEDRKRLKRLHAEQGFVADFEIQLYRKDKSRMWVSLNARAVRNEAGEIIMYEGTTEDITERKYAEQALKRSEATMRSVFSVAPVGIAITGSNRVPEWMNEAMIGIMGYTTKDLAVSGARLLYASPEEYARVGEAVLDGIQENGIGIIDTKWVHKNGEVKDVHLRGAAIDPEDLSAGLIFIAVDVTNQKSAEQTLQESEAKYRLVVESSVVGVYIIQGGLFRFVSRRFCDIYGYTYEEIVDKIGPMDIAHPEDRAVVEENIRKRVAGEVDSIEYVHRGVRKDGKAITVKVLGSSTMYNGRPAVSGTVIDITREKTLESQLLQSQKMEAIGMLAGGIAHDFNNILTTMTGYGTLLQMNMRKDDPLQTYVDHILSASLKAAGLTQSLLTFSRQQPLSLIAININDMVRGTAKLLKRLLTEDVSLKTLLCNEDIIVLADTTQIDQILFNLATNARDAMPEGGSLTIETKLIELDVESAQAYGIGKSGRYALLSVSDTGIGMDRKTMDRIFEPFFTTKESGKGTGLGLSTVYGIVKQHKGFLTVYSERGHGTTFHVYLPIAGVSAQREEPDVERIARGKETILLAEDSDQVRRLIKDILTKYGYRVIEAADGELAVEEFNKNDGKIDLMILDSVMPRKNGRATYDEIRKKKPGVKVLFMSGYTRDIVLDKGIEDGSFDFVSKPVTPAELLRKVRQALDK